MSTAKLHINLSQGLIEAEGNEAFVLKVYDDFKARLQTIRERQEGVPDDPSSEDKADSGQPTRGGKGRKKAASARKAAGEAQGGRAGGISRYEPKRDPDLDLAELAAFVGQFEPKGNPERYLLYAWFLKENLGKDSCSIDDIYSCFLEMKDDIPVRIGQNIIDTRARNGFLKFTSPHDITITATGINHFNKKIARKTAE